MYHHDTSPVGVYSKVLYLWEYQKKHNQDREIERRCVMKAKKLIMATIVAFVIMVLLSSLWYMVIMGDYYNQEFTEVQRPEFKMVWIFIGYLVGAFLMAYIYPLGYQGGSPANEGMRFGLLIGLITALPSALVYYGVWTIPFGPTLIDVIYLIIEKIVGGLVIGLIYGKGASSKA